MVVRIVANGTLEDRDLAVLPPDGSCLQRVVVIRGIAAGRVACILINGPGSCVGCRAVTCTINLDDIGPLTALEPNGITVLQSSGSGNVEVSIVRHPSLALVLGLDGNSGRGYSKDKISEELHAE